jgi:hypothetical protein
MNWLTLTLALVGGMPGDPPPTVLPQPSITSSPEITIGPPTPSRTSTDHGVSGAPLTAQQKLPNAPLAPVQTISPYGAIQYGGPTPIPYAVRAVEGPFPAQGSYVPYRAHHGAYLAKNRGEPRWSSWNEHEAFFWSRFDLSNLHDPPAYLSGYTGTGAYPSPNVRP